MSAKAKVVVTLVGTLATGVILGALGSGALAQRRARALESLGRPGGFVTHMREVIQPRDSTQWEAVRPYLEHTDLQNREIIRSANDRLREEFMQMREQLTPLLDEAQLSRLDRLQRRPPLPIEGTPPPRGPGRPPESGTRQP